MGMELEVYIDSPVPPANEELAAATSLFPSAEEATLSQRIFGMLFDIQVAPELVEV